MLAAGTQRPAHRDETAMNGAHTHPYREQRNLSGPPAGSGEEHSEDFAAGEFRHGGPRMSLVVEPISLELRPSLPTCTPSPPGLYCFHGVRANDGAKIIIPLNLRSKL